MNKYLKGRAVSHRYAYNRLFRTKERYYVKKIKKR